MSFKIDQNRPVAPVPRAATEAVPRATPAGTSSRADDSVSLTGAGLLAQELTRSLAQAPAVDAGRVAETRAALAEGRYTVDAQQVAAKLLRFEWEMQTS
jgi:negative regulator of flagellin synthesis FlgM